METMEQSLLDQGRVAGVDHPDIDIGATQQFVSRSSTPRCPALSVGRAWYSQFSPPDEIIRGHARTED